MIAMILAAGRGERLRPLTDTMPKALVDVAGTSLLERHLEKVRSSGIEDVVNDQQAVVVADLLHYIVQTVHGDGTALVDADV